MSSIYKTIQELENLNENIDSQQRQVKQMGADFDPKSINVLQSKNPPKHPADGYLVGESEQLSEEESRQEIQRKIDRAKELIKAARWMKNNPLVADLEKTINSLEKNLATAPDYHDINKPKPRTPIPTGYKYDPYEEVEFDGDNRKIYHTVVTPNGKRVDVDFTPYDKMTGRDIELWVKLGMPKSQGGRNFDSETLERMAKAKGLI